jgi:adenylate cyclase
MISESTNDMLKGKSVYTRPVDLVTVKGKKLPVKIFELIDEGSVPQSVQDQIGHATEAFELYLKQEWDKSIQKYQEAIKAVNGDPTAELFVTRCEEFKKDPPGDDWSGVYVMKTK